MIIIEGTIGAGKSTLLSLVSSHLTGYHIASEPLELWDSFVTGPSLLQRFYEDPYRWAFAMEQMTLLSRVREAVLLQQQYGPRLIMERSLFSGRYCFAHNSYANGFMNETEWYIYNQWFDYVTHHYPLTPRAVVYIRISPRQAFERVQKRNRLSEKTISLDYLSQIGELHDQLLLRESTRYGKKMPVLQVDGSSDQIKQVQEIISFVKELT